MEMRTELLVSLGAAAASDSAQCLERFLERAEVVGLTPKELEEVADIVDQVKTSKPERL